jgi:hypothetical protein
VSFQEKRAIALADPEEAGDERDRLIALRGERVGGYVLAELVEGATRIVLDRRGT